MHKFLVLGTGVGSAIAYALKHYFGETMVTIADVSLEKLQAAVDIECSGKVFNVGDSTDFWMDFDVVISALPAKYNAELTQNAIDADVHFCDLGGIVDVTRKQLALNEKYPFLKKSIVPDCGLMPGLGVMLAKDLVNSIINEGGTAKNIEILVGGLPKNPQLPTQYQIVFSPEGLKHLCYDPSPILRDGHIVIAPPFSEHSVTNLPIMFPMLVVETFISAGASLSAESFQKLGVQNFCERTIRWPGFVEAFKDLPPEKFENFVKNNVPVTDKDHPDLVYMEVRVDELWSKVRVDDFADGYTSMQRATGYPTALVAFMLADGFGAPGVRLPENVFEDKNLSIYVDNVTKLL